MANSWRINTAFLNNLTALIVHSDHRLVHCFVHHVDADYENYCNGSAKGRPVSLTMQCNMQISVRRAEKPVGDSLRGVTCLMCLCNTMRFLRGKHEQ
jgi:hypothetical protein